MEAVWARSSNWELDIPRAGDVLPRNGIRLSGGTEAPAASKGVTRRDHVTDPSEASAEYAITGTIISAVDFQIGRETGPAHGGTDVVLSVGGERVQAQVPGPASTLHLGGRLTVSGEIAFLADHEWESFELVDTRRRWFVENVRTYGDGEFLLLLRAAD